MPSRRKAHRVPERLLTNAVSYHRIGDGVPGFFGCGFQVKPLLGWDFRDRLTPDYSAVMVLRGSGTYYDHAGRSWPLRPGTLLQRFTHLRHSHHITPDGTWVECWITLPPTTQRMLIDLRVIDPRQPVLTPGIDPSLIIALDALRRDMQRAGPQESLGYLAALISLLLEILSSRRDGQGLRVHGATVTAACTMLARHPGTPLARLAADAGLPAERFRKLFRQETGSSLARFRVRCRIDLASDRLHDPTLSIQAIAAELGYATPFAFSAGFRRETGMSPSAYRRARP